MPFEYITLEQGWQLERVADLVLTNFLFYQLFLFGSK